MMGFGSYGQGSSASSSNLSPLAQPFTVDRSLPKPNLNPLVPSVEDPYSYSYRPAFDNWLHLHPSASLPDSFAGPNSHSEPDSTHVPNFSSAGNYAHYGSRSIPSFGTHMKPKTVTSSVGPFPYDQQQSESIRTSYVEAKPYYPQNTSASIHDNTSPVVPNESASDMFSVSNFSPLDRTYHTGYTKNFPVSMDQWGGFCDGLSDKDQGRRKALDGKLFIGGNDGTVPMTLDSLLNQATKDLSLLTCDFSAGTLAAEGLTAESVDISAWKNSSGLGGKGRMDDSHSLLSEGTSRFSLNFSRPGVRGSVSRLQEAHFPQEPSSVEAHFPKEPSSDTDMKTWSSLFPDTASYERCFTQFDSCSTDPMVSYSPITNSSRPLPLGARANGTNAPASLMSPSRSMNFSQYPGSASGNNESAGGITSNIKEPFIQTSSKCEEASGCTFAGINNYVVDSFPLKKDVPSEQKPPVVDSIDLLRRKSELQSSHLTPLTVNSMDLLNEKSEQANNSKPSDACNIVSGGAGGAGSADIAKRISEICDQFNPAVDSPCWKGALSSRQSPFGFAEVSSSYLPVKEFEGCDRSILEGPQTLGFKADGVVAVSLQKVEGNLVPNDKACGKDCLSSLSKGLSSVGSFLYVEDGLKDSVNVAPYHSKVNTESKIPGSDGIQEQPQQRKEHEPSVCSKRISELKPSHLMQTSHQNSITTTELSTSMVKDLALDGSSCVQFPAVEHASGLPFPAASVPVGLAKLVGGASDIETEYPVAKSNIGLLVSAMYNLSELLLSSCYRDTEALKEQDHQVLRHVINNLDRCISMEAGLPQLQFPESSTCSLTKLMDPHQVSGTCRSQVNSVEAVNELDQHDLKGKMHSTVSSGQGNKLEDIVSMRDETGIEIDNGTTQAIKKIMEEKLGNEETHPQTILFKNLWLEAEAALCSIKYKAHSAKLKTEMEKWNREQEKRKPNDTGVHLNLKVSQDRRDDDVLIQEMESAVSDKSTQKTPIDIDVQVEDVEASVNGSNAEDIEASIVNKAEDIESSVVTNSEESEASVLTRFRILKCRAGGFNSMDKRHLANSNDIGPHEEQVESMVSQNDDGIGNVRMLSRPIKLIDVGSSERRKPWPFIRNSSEDGCVKVTSRPDMRHDETSCNARIIGLDLDVCQQQETMKELGAWVCDEQVNAVMPNRDWDQCPGGGFDSPSSDWEHVLNEELKWQN